MNFTTPDIGRTKTQAELTWVRLRQAGLVIIAACLLGLVWLPAQATNSGPAVPTQAQKSCFSNQKTDCPGKNVAVAWQISQSPGFQGDQDAKNPPSNPEKLDEGAGKSETESEPPGVPANIHLEIKGGDVLTATWDPPVDGGEVGLYRISWGIKGGDDSKLSSSSVGVDKPRSIDLNNLQRGNSYRVAVTAENQAGQTMGVAEVEIPANQPSQPTILSIKPVLSTSLDISFVEPRVGGGDPQTTYRVQWRQLDQGFDTSRQRDLTESQLTTSSGQIPRRVFKFHLNGLPKEIFTVRVIAVNGETTSNSEEMPVPTPVNKLMFFIEKTLVGEYGYSHPWLEQTWDYMKKDSFDIFIDPDISGGYVWHRHYPQEPLAITKSTIMGISDDQIGGDFLSLYAHEMAHVYTITNDISPRPGTLAMAFLYFNHLAKDSDIDWCTGRELYADAASLLVIDYGSDSYWRDGCPSEGLNTPTPEAIEVVRQAFTGQIPDWFQQNHQSADGSLDLESIWQAVKGVENPFYRTTVVYQLREEFGGYCNPAQANDSAFSSSSDLRNPWRDGGCTPQSPQNIVIEPDRWGSMEISWQAPIYDGGLPIKSYVVEWRLAAAKDRPFNQTRVSATSRRTVVFNLRDDSRYLVRVRAENNFNDGDPVTKNDGWGPPSETIEIRTPKN